MPKIIKIRSFPTLDNFCHDIRPLQPHLQICSLIEVFIEHLAYKNPVLGTRYKETRHYHWPQVEKYRKGDGDNEV